MIRLIIFGVLLGFGRAANCPTLGSALSSIVDGLATCAEANTDQIYDLCSFCFSEELKVYMENCDSESLESLAANLGVTLSSETCNTLPFGCEDNLSGSLASNAATVCAQKIFAAGTSLECSDGKLNGIKLSGSGIIGGESDIDCGGPFCSACGLDRTCRRDSDCAIDETCENQSCYKPSDSIENAYIFNWVTVPLLCVTAVATLARIHFHVKFEEKRKTEMTREHESSLYRGSNTTKDIYTTTRGTKTVATSRVTYTRADLGASRATVPTTQDEEVPLPPAYLSLDKVLADCTARSQFYAFCESKFAAENLLFWDALIQYEALWENPTASDEAREQEARLIVETFVSHDGSSEVNLAHNLRFELNQLYQRSRVQPGNIFAADSFVPAKMEIYKLMNTNFFREFLEHVKTRRYSPALAAAAEGKHSGKDLETTAQQNNRSSPNIPLEGGYSTNAIAHEEV